jgi:hypothetical protein
MMLVPQWPPLKQPFRALEQNARHMCLPPPSLSSECVSLSSECVVVFVCFGCTVGRAAGAVSRGRRRGKRHVWVRAAMIPSRTTVTARGWEGLEVIAGGYFDGILTIF